MLYADRFNSPSHITQPYFLQGMSEIVIVNEETENEKLLQKKKFGNW